jgi:hypothetical protein
MDSRHPAPPDQPPTPALLPRQFTFRFNRRTSRAWGLLFYRLLQQTTGTDPHPLSELIGAPATTRTNTQTTKRQLHSSGYAGSVFQSDMRDLDPSQYGEADRREVDPPIQVESATWSPGDQLDWWVKERREWFGRVRGKDGCQRRPELLIVDRPGRRDRGKKR